MRIAYKAFYRVFDSFSSVPIPHDAGDFSLMDRRVVRWLLACRERDLFIRGLRAYVGSARPAYLRAPGAHVRRSTNSMLEEHRLGEEGHPVVQPHAARSADIAGVAWFWCRSFLGAAAIPRPRLLFRRSRRAASPRWCC